MGDFPFPSLYLADGEWWRTFGNDPIMGYAIVICAIPILLVPIFFVVGLVRSVGTKVKMLGTTQAESVNASLPRTSRNNRITTFISPPQEYVLTQGELRPDDVGPQGVPGLLDAFERSVLRSPDNSISLARLKGSKEDQNSFLIVYRATVGTDFLGWLNIYETGMAIQWKVKAAEVRAVRSPDAGNSHFNYSHDHEKGLYNAVFKRKDGDGGLATVWDLATGNVVTDGTAKKATWFKGYLMQRFNDALTDVEKHAVGYSAQQGAPPASQGGAQPSITTASSNSAPSLQTLSNSGPQEQPDRRD